MDFNKIILFLGWSFLIGLLIAGSLFGWLLYLMHDLPF